MNTTRSSYPASDLQASIADLLAELVHIPSRAGVDSCHDIFAFLADWLERHGVPCQKLFEECGQLVAIVGQIEGLSNQAYVLDAPVDTAGFGEIAAWTKDPLGAEICDGWLYGRGSADAKAGIAIFCHLLSRFRPQHLTRTLEFVFDADEHTGHFRGIRAYLDRFGARTVGVLIGYPGHDRIGIGARGFWRATLHVGGVAAHSGSSQDRGTNAITKAARLIDACAELQQSIAEAGAFPLSPKITVTGIRGGGEFSLVPDNCEIDLDVRLTPAFTAAVAETRFHALLEGLDASERGTLPSRMFVHASAPAYRLPENAAITAALEQGCERILGRRLPFVVTGPSNVGNLLAQKGIPATCGFGVGYRNLHAPDECVDLSSLVPSFRIYEAALDVLLRPTEP